jgi:hypothetical protein
MDVALPLVTTSTDSSPAPPEADKATWFIDQIQHIFQQVQDILQKSNSKYKQCHDQHQVPHKFQVGDKVWLHLQKERLTGPHWKLFPLHYGSYTITKVVGDNSFELNIPPFLGLHPVFNVALLRPYFPPLLDTSEIAEQLTPTELNPDSCNRNPMIILWTHRSRALDNKGSIFIESSKQGSSCTKASGSPGAKFSRNFLI